MDHQSASRAEFSITEANVVAGTRSAMKRHLTRMPYALIFGVAYLAVIVLLAILFADRDILPLLVAAFIAPPIAYWLIMRFAVPWQAKRHFRQLAMLSDQSFAEWDNRGITLGGPKGQARLEWNDFFAWDRIDGLVLLYQSEATFNMLPIDAIGVSGADEIEGHLLTCRVKRR